jgi:hypothetical protein
MTKSAAAIERAQCLSKTLGRRTGDFSDATVLRKFGDVPDDLSAL